MEEKIKFPDAYIRNSFSSSYEAAGLPSEGGRVVVVMTCHKWKVSSSGAELGALVLATNSVDTQGKEPRSLYLLVHHHFLVLTDGCHKPNHQLQAAPDRKLFRRKEQSPHAIL